VFKLTLGLTDGKSKRRDQLVIMTEIMGICKKGSAKTNIMFKANLSFEQLNQYLSYLSFMGLLEKTTREGRDNYRATDRGLEFMARQQQVINLLNGKNQNCNLNSTRYSVAPFPRNKTNILY